MSHFQYLLCVRCLKLLLVFGMVLTALPGLAEQKEATVEPADAAVWRVEFSPWTHHYRFSEEYKYVWALGLERETPNRGMFGLTAFSNSFGQPSAYAYYGHVFNNVLDRTEALYLKLTIGIIYGYKVPFEDRVPLNYYGFSPAIIPAVGWRLDKNWSVQANLLGTSAVMFMVSSRL